MAEPTPAPRSLLYLPASNARAIEKARTLSCDMVILDLEDAVRQEDKSAARAAAVAAGDLGKPFAIRINAHGTPWYGADAVAIRQSKARYVILPKCESGHAAHDVASITGKTVMAMIETPRGVLNAADIAAQSHGLIAGSNDLAVALRIPRGRSGLRMAHQMIVLAARAYGRWAFDGVFNGLDDPAGLEADCAEAKALGYDGKTVIHPNQIEAANRAFSPTQEEIDEAAELVAAAADGAIRFKDRMVEALDVEAARALLSRTAR